MAGFRHSVGSLTLHMARLLASAPVVTSQAWPIGSIFVSAVSTDPGVLLGFGTWQAFGSGRVLVGQDTGQTEFDVLEETGGAKTHTLTTAEMPSHTHVQDAHTHTSFATGVGLGLLANGAAGAGVTGSTTATNQNTGGGGAHNNLQPYIVVRFWKRTA